MYRVIGGDKQEYGPSTVDEVVQWIEEGRLNGESLAQDDSTPAWVRLAQFPEFAEALARQSGQVGSPPPLPAAVKPPLRELNVSDCLSRGWQLWTSNFSLFFAATFMVWTINVALQFLPLMGFVYWLLRGVLYGGLCLVVLKRVRGQPVQVNEVFTGFGSGFMQLILVGMVTSLLIGIGFALCMIPGIYLAVIWIFSIPVVADRRVEFWPGMEISRKAVTGQWPKVFVLALIAFLPVILVTVYTEVTVMSAMYASLKEVIPTSGMPDFKTILETLNKVAAELAGTIVPLVIASKVVLLLNLPFGLSALMCAYEEIMGPHSRRPD